MGFKFQGKHQPRTQVGNEVGEAPKEGSSQLIIGKQIYEPTVAISLLNHILFLFLPSHKELAY